jgi:hypothetical protein
VASFAAAVLIPPIGAVLAVVAMAHIRRGGRRGFSLALAASIIGAALSGAIGLGLIAWTTLTTG